MLPILSVRFSDRDEIISRKIIDAKNINTYPMNIHVGIWPYTRIRPVFPSGTDKNIVATKYFFTANYFITCVYNIYFMYAPNCAP